MVIFRPPGRSGVNLHGSGFDDKHLVFGVFGEFSGLGGNHKILALLESEHCHSYSVKFLMFPVENCFFLLFIIVDFYTPCSSLSCVFALLDKHQYFDRICVQ